MENIKKIAIFNVMKINKFRLKMKQYVLLALLCIGVMSAWAIAGSISEPIQILSNAEKVSIIAGDYCHYCEACTEAYNCDTMGGASTYCDGTPSAWCGYYDLSTSIGDICYDGSGSLVGGCYDPESHSCSIYKDCRCIAQVSGNWTCSNGGSDKQYQFTYSAGPCPSS